MSPCTAESCMLKVMTIDSSPFLYYAVQRFCVFLLPVPSTRAAKNFNVTLT